MHFKRFAAFAALLSVSAVPLVPAAAQTAASAQRNASSQFTPERFRAHVSFLADDLLEGRSTGTRGYDLAARYVATQMEALGLRPGNRDSWYQRVPFVRFAATEPPRLTIGGRSFVHGEGVTFRQSPQEGRTQISAPAVFVGYGLDNSALGLDDYRGLDVSGKIVVMLDGMPAGLPSDVAAHLRGEKRSVAARHGAVGIVFLRTLEGTAPERHGAAHQAVEPGTVWVGTDGQPFNEAPQVRFIATGDGALAEALFAGARRPLAEVRAEHARPGVRPRGFPLAQSVSFDRTSANETITSPNVVGVIPGSDPALAGEYVLLMAHLDGLGIANAPAANGDNIRNGAMDNATGVATLLEVARQMMEPGNRPRRSILLAAVTAEERGLLGAQYLAKHPVVDGRIVSVVNLDMPILTYDFSDVIAFGAEHSTMGPAVQRAAARMGVALSDDPLPTEGLFTRSDHYMFVREGVPSVFLMTGFAGQGAEKFRSFLANQYHSPADDLNLPFNWQTGARFAELNYLIASEIANADQAPRWYRDSFFGNHFAPEAPKAPRPAATPATN